jgi:hypothetical protein
MYRGEHARGGDGVLYRAEEGTNTVGCRYRELETYTVFIFRAAVVVFSKFFVLG